MYIYYGDDGIQLRFYIMNMIIFPYRDQKEFSLTCARFILNIIIILCVVDNTDE